MISYEQFKEIYDALGETGDEFPLSFRDRPGDEYMIVACHGGPSFQKYYGSSRYEEQFYTSIDELFHAVQPDGVCLERDWDSIDCIMLGDVFRLDDPDGLEECWEIYVPLIRKQFERWGIS